MNIAQALAAARARIESVDARLLLQHALGLSHAQLAAYPERKLDAAQQMAFDALVARRVAGEPIAYLIGWREFYGRRFRVTPDVLIPRPETAQIVDVAREKASGRSRLRILDLGAGSGALAVTLALELRGAQVTACDVSQAALEVARVSARDLGAVVRWVHSDWFDAFGDERFDLIVSNPPYIAPGDAHLAQGDLRYEPQCALVGAGVSGLGDIEIIVAGAAPRLESGGWLIIEHGRGQGETTCRLMAAAGLVACATLPDLAGLDRVSLGRRVG